MGKWENRGKGKGEGVREEMGEVGEGLIDVCVAG